MTHIPCILDVSQIKLCPYSQISPRRIVSSLVFLDFYPFTWSQWNFQIQDDIHLRTYFKTEKINQHNIPDDSKRVRDSNNKKYQEIDL